MKCNKIILKCARKKKWAWGPAGWYNLHKKNNKNTSSSWAFLRRAGQYLSYSGICLKDQWREGSWGWYEWEQLSLFSIRRHNYRRVYSCALTPLLCQGKEWKASSSTGWMRVEWKALSSQFFLMESSQDIPGKTFNASTVEAGACILLWVWRHLGLHRELQNSRPTRIAQWGPV